MEIIVVKLGMPLNTVKLCSRFFLVLPITAIGLFACARPSANADYGGYPHSYEASIRDKVEENLIDPESARYKFGTPAKAWTNNGWLRGGEVVFTGYSVPVDVNARNTLGGYTGLTIHQF